jgi:hypothetical protein
MKYPPPARINNHNPLLIGISVGLQLGEAGQQDGPFPPREEGGGGGGDP